MANRDYNWTSICEHCYLSFCCYPHSRLEMYCPEVAGKKHGLEPDTVLELTKITPVNRRWIFLEKVRDAKTRTGRTA